MYNVHTLVTAGEGLHTATELVKQKQQQARLQEKQARAAHTAGPTEAQLQVSHLCLMLMLLYFVCIALLKQRGSASKSLLE
jgi:hypothetical protein